MLTTTQPKAALPAGARHTPNPRQRALYDAIVDFKRANDGNSPSARDLLAVTDITSSSVLAYNLKQLERAGLIDIDRGVARSIRVVGGRWTLNS